ncbi:hypothetical protein SERLA73DRAFT_189185, partial [Serpula lacrymans var. lacrymans S7.3]
MGLLGCLVASLQLILYYALQDVSTYVAPHLLVSKCYVNSVMASLNARHSLRKMIRRDNALDMAVISSSDNPHTLNT